MRVDRKCVVKTNPLRQENRGNQMAKQYPPIPGKTVLRKIQNLEEGRLKKRWRCDLNLSCLVDYFAASNHICHKKLRLWLFTTKIISLTGNFACQYIYPGARLFF